MVTVVDRNLKKDRNTELHRMCSELPDGKEQTKLVVTKIGQTEMTP